MSFHKFLTMTKEYLLNTCAEIFIGLVHSPSNLADVVASSSTYKMV